MGGERLNLRFENQGRQFRSLDFAPKYYVGVRVGGGLICVLKTRVTNFALLILHPNTMYGERPNSCSENKGGGKFCDFDFAPKTLCMGEIPAPSGLP